MTTTADASPVTHSVHHTPAPQHPHLMLPLSFPQAQAQSSPGVLCLLTRPPHSHARVRFICLSGPIQAGSQLVPLSLQGPARSMGLGLRVGVAPTITTMLLGMPRQYPTLHGVSHSEAGCQVHGGGCLLTVKPPSRSFKQSSIRVLVALE